MLLRGRVMTSFKCAGIVASFIAMMTAAPLAIAADAADAQRATQQLFDAIRANNVAAVEASLAAGANPDATDRWGVKAVDLAVDKGYYRIAHVITAARHTARTAPSTAPQASAIAPATAATKATAAARRSPSTQAASDNAPAASSSLNAGPGAGAAAWPAGTPNPFDPAMPPPRSQLVISDGGDETLTQ